MLKIQYLTKNKHGDVTELRLRIQTKVILSEYIKIRMYMNVSECIMQGIKMYVYVSECMLNVSECIRMYQNVCDCIRMNVSE